MNWFLKAKHWQIFILIFAAPLVLELMGFAATVLLRQPAIIFGCIGLIGILVLGTQFGWYYTVGTALANRINPNAGMNVKRFRIFVVVPLIYIGIFMLGMCIFAFCLLHHGRPSPLLGLSIFLIFPMHLFSMFCIFYSLWFVSKSLKMAERWNHVELGDYIGDFFLVWFFFIGVWFVQPRINRLFDPTLPPPPVPPNTLQNPQYYSQQYPAQNPPNYPPPNH